MPDDVTARLGAGDVDNVSAYVTMAARKQIRRAAILAHLAQCEAAGHAPLTNDDVDEFRRLVDEEPREVRLDL